MNNKKYEERAKRIEQYYLKHGKDKKKTYLHFTDEGLNKRTIYNILRKHEELGDVSHKKGDVGRKATACTPEMFDKCAKLFKENPKLSFRQAALELNVPRTTVYRILSKMKENDLETYKISETDPRCPTCHQKIDPSKVNLLKPKREKEKEKVKQNKKKLNNNKEQLSTNNSSSNSNNNDKLQGDNGEEDNNLEVKQNVEIEMGKDVEQDGIHELESFL